jgi:hypothetical protein
VSPPGEKRVTDFVAQFADKPGLIHEFKANPHKMARDYGLDDDQIAVVASGDVVQIQETITSEGGFAQNAFCILVVFG